MSTTPKPTDIVSINGLNAITAFDLPTIQSPDFNTKYTLLVDYLNQLDELKKKVDGEIKRVMEDEYNTSGETNLVSGDRKYTYIPPTTRVSVDSKKLQAECPDIYAKYARVSQVSAVLKSTVMTPKEDK